MAVLSKNNSAGLWMLEQEARALLTRLARIKPFALQETMVAAAAIPAQAQTAIERHLFAGRARLRSQVRDFLNWLTHGAGRNASPAAAQRRFTFLKLRFNAALAQLDIFAASMTQRSEADTGVLLAGLDAAAAEALKLGDYYDAPPVICYLDRSHGAAIRRARTRLPGGDQNPVAVIRVPRERMIGSGIASSLVHEVGHQAAALLDLIDSIRPTLRGLQRGSTGERVAWEYWDRCLSEIVADFWSVARLGITSTLGLIGVVSLPPYFVFRIGLEDPHPAPWLRVKLSCAMGKALFPHSQWDGLEEIWESLYPPDQLEPARREQLSMFERTMPALAELLANHRPRSLRGASMQEALLVSERQPDRLRAYLQAWRASPDQMRRAPPSLVFAVIGQARADGRMSPEQEGRTLTSMLTHWALSSALDSSAVCAARPAAGPRQACGFYQARVRQARA